MSEETFRWIVAGGVGIAALSMFGMAVAALVVLRVLSRLQERMHSIADRAEPVIDHVRHIVHDSGPKVGAIVNAAQETAVNARDVSAVVREEAHRFKEVAADFADAGREIAGAGREMASVGRDMAGVGHDVAARARARVAEMDAAVDHTVAQVQNMGDNVRTSMMKPIHEVSGVLAGIKAGVAAFANGHRPSVARATQDEEMFI